MGKPKPLPEGASEKLRAALKKARTKEEFRRVLAVWLRVAPGLNGAQVAKGLDWTPAWVYYLQTQYRRQGEKAFQAPGRGGRRRENMSRTAERNLLRAMLAATRPGEIVPARAIQEAYEKQVGHPVSKSAIYRMLRRHNWRRAALHGARAQPGWARAVPEAGGG